MFLKKEGTYRLKFSSGQKQVFKDTFFRLTYCKVASVSKWIKTFNTVDHKLQPFLKEAMFSETGSAGKMQFQFFQPFNKIGILYKAVFLLPY